jgi:hypothetical protein
VITQIDLTREEQPVQAGDKAWQITLMMIAHQAETGKWAKEKETFLAEIKENKANAEER